MDYRKFRISLGLTQAQVAKLVNVSVSQVSRLESGKKIEDHAWMKVHLYFQKQEMGRTWQFIEEKMEFKPQQPSFGCMVFCVLLLVLLIVTNL